MKKMFSVILLVIVATMMLTACGKFTCDVCGEEKSGKKYKESAWGEEFEICKDCYKAMEELADAWE